jgi:hypothetical protein
MKQRPATLAMFLLLWAGPAFGQGCAMCSVTAKNAPKEGQRAINRGVAVLLAPPLGFMTLGIGAAMRYGKKRDRDRDRDEEGGGQ